MVNFISIKIFNMAPINESPEIQRLIINEAYNLHNGPIITIMSFIFVPALIGCLVAAFIILPKKQAI
jgi:hypothetical protein